MNIELADALEGANNTIAYLNGLGTKVGDNLAKHIATLVRYASPQAGGVVGWAKQHADGRLDFDDAGTRPTGHDYDALADGEAFIPLYTAPQPQGDATGPTDEAVAKFRRFLNAQKPVDGKITTRQARHILRAWPAASGQVSGGWSDAIRRLAEVMPPKPMPGDDYGFQLSPNHLRELHERFAALSPTQARPDECPACRKAWGEHRSGYSASRCQMKPAPTADGGAWTPIEQCTACYGCGYINRISGPATCGKCDGKGTRHPAPKAEVARLVEAAKGLRAAYLRSNGSYPLPPSIGHTAMQEMDAALAAFTTPENDNG